MRKILLLFLLFVSLPSWAAPAKLQNLKITTNKQHAQLVFGLSRPVQYHIWTMHKPDRLVVDLHDTKLAMQPKINTMHGMIKKVRMAEHKGNLLRVVLDLQISKPAKYKSYFLKPTKTQSNRLVLDLGYKTATKIKLQPHVPKHVTTVKKPKKLRNVIIVIDPGHGGKDPGATGPHGTHEKNVVLAIAKDMQQMIDAEYGFTAKLTRHGDYFISLRRRLAIERHDHADMFIAIHADAYRDHVAHGASVFALSQRGATSEAAHWLAQKENESELGDVLANKSNTLRSVLIDLAQTASISSSLILGDSIIQQLTKVATLHHDFVEQAAFVVLKEPDVPSLLVETGFISNSKEERRLRSSAYQHKIAHALTLGIIDYYKHHPPRGTFLAAKRDRNLLG
ncbi:MAG: N-acetylmuramoyl-L-alanine amidase [Gammaproteobacteria bacterium]|nr:N-acetylmuramoyl-L-alanine amidase [Gammaproteobacteria bacterium]